MKFFQPTLLPEPLGPQLREARTALRLTTAKVAAALHCTSEEIEALENDTPIDPRRARLQTVSYLRFLGLNPTDFKDALPPLPDLYLKKEKILSRVENPITMAIQTVLIILAPMGRFALIAAFTIMLLGGWGLVRQLSRVRSMPWVTYTYTVHDSTTR